MFCSPELVFGGTKSVGSSFHVLRSRTHFKRYRGRRVPFLCFALLDSFSSVPRASSPLFMFFAPGLIFGGTVGDRSRFQVLRSWTRFGRTVGVGSNFNFWRTRTRFRRFLGCLVQFSCFALPDSFSVVPRAAGPVFIFWAPGLIFGGSEGVGCSF
jgi:hypothetical protein